MGSQYPGGEKKAQARRAGCLILSDCVGSTVPRKTPWHLDGHAYTLQRCHNAATITVQPIAVMTERFALDDVTVFVNKFHRIVSFSFGVPPYKETHTNHLSERRIQAASKLPRGTGTWGRNRTADLGLMSPSL